MQIAIPLVQEVATLLNMNYLEYVVYRTLKAVQLSSRQMFILNADPDTNVEIPMPRFPDGLFKIIGLYKFYLK